MSPTCWAAKDECSNLAQTRAAGRVGRSSSWDAHGRALCRVGTGGAVAGLGRCHRRSRPLVPDRGGRRGSLCSGDPLQETWASPSLIGWRMDAQGDRSRTLLAELQLPAVMAISQIRFFHLRGSPPAYGSTEIAPTTSYRSRSLTSLLPALSHWANGTRALAAKSVEAGDDMGGRSVTPRTAAPAPAS